jgi:hypothetical protein
LQISNLAGQPFQIGYGGVATASDNGYGSATGTLFFFGNFPPGAVITSCNGFRQDLTTAARKTSWGKLKTIYR